MTTHKQMNVQNKVEWQTKEYDADCSDVEGLSAMPCPVAPSHQNYPINSVINDLEFSLEFFQQLRRDGSLLPVDIVQINRTMQTFRQELNSVLEAVSSRHTPAKSAKDPVTERQQTEELVVPRAVTVEHKRPNGCSDSGHKSRRRMNRPKTVTFKDRAPSRRSGTRIEQEEEKLRSSDSANGSSPRSRPKSAEASIVKHKARHKKLRNSELTEHTELEPTKRTKELKKEIKKIRRIFQGMLDGTLAKDKNPQLRMMQKMVSDLLERDPDFSLMELVENQLSQLY